MTEYISRDAQQLSTCVQPYPVVILQSLLSTYCAPGAILSEDTGSMQPWPSWGPGSRGGPEIEEKPTGL